MDYLKKTALGVLFTSYISFNVLWEFSRYKSSNCSIIMKDKNNATELHKNIQAIPFKILHVRVIFQKRGTLERNYKNANERKKVYRNFHHCYLSTVVWDTKNSLKVYFFKFHSVSQKRRALWQFWLRHLKTPAKKNFWNNLRK